MATPSFQDLVLNSHTGEILKTYTPSPHDGKFAVDLLFALQHHTHLTALQNTFLFTVLCPGPLSWKLSFFNWLYTLPPAQVYLIPIALIVLVSILLYLIRKFSWRLFAKKQPLVFLELTFPHTTSKSAYATEQFLTLLHSLARRRSLKHRALGHKKQYSLEIVATREEGIRYILGVSSADESIIKKSLLSYLPGLKIKTITDYLPEDLKKKGDNTDEKLKIIELRLTSDFALPLKQHKALNEHDPIAYLTGNMTKLTPGELMVFQVVATPITKSGHGDIIKHIEMLKKRIYRKQPLADKLFESPIQKIIAVPWAIMTVLLKIVNSVIKFFMSMIIVFFDSSGDTAPFLAKEPMVVVLGDTHNPYEQQLQEEVKEKIDCPMFETSLRLFVRTSDSTQSDLRVSGFLASFASLGSTYQSLVLKTKNLLSLLFPPFTPFMARQVSLANNPILSASELADIYHFPYTETTKTEDLVKSKNQELPAPLSFKQTEAHLDNTFAQNSYGGSETAIGQTLEERRRHTYILGATGSGKTNLLSDMIYNDIVNGKGVAVVDPHGDLTEKLLRVIPKERIKDVVWFAPDDDEFPIALNLLELPTDTELTGSQLQKQKSLITSSIISIIQKFYDAKFFGPRMEYVLRNTILTALETPDPTLQTVLDILTKTKYRKEVISGLTNKVLQDYWIYEFQKLGTLQRNSVISPITNKIGGLLASPINYNILSQTKSKIDFEDVINNGKILLCDLSKGKIGEDESSFFGSLILAKIQLAALRRAHIKEDNRKDFYLYVDEFQNFATATFSELVSEARKYRLSTIIAHQSISQIDDRDIVKVILANVGTVICFKTANPEDEQFILPIFSPEVSKHEISNLPLYNFYMKVSVGQAEDTFLAQADHFDPEESEKTARAVIDQSRKRYATKAKETSDPKKEEAQSDEPKPTTKKQIKPRKTSPEKESKTDGILP